MPEIAGGCETNEVASGYLPIILFACEVILLTDNFEDFLLDHGSNFKIINAEFSPFIPLICIIEAIPGIFANSLLILSTTLAVLVKVAPSCN